MTIDKYTLKSNFDNKYFYVKTQEKLLNMHNRKKWIKMLDLLNQRK